MRTIQSDIRTSDLNVNHFDIILAGAVLHHLRDDKEREYTFNKLYKLLKPGGCLMIADLVAQDNMLLTEYTLEKYAEYLEKAGGENMPQKYLIILQKKTLQDQ
ncbi:MAG: methyltransferase domain-containing protein [Endomicrobium sp.]|nr:methyltransferase domain-containing protein [Endomicrobium sp.]